MSEEEEDPLTAVSRKPLIRDGVKRGSSISGINRGIALRASSIAQRQISVEALSRKKLVVNVSVGKSNSRASCTTPSAADHSLGQKAVESSVFDFDSSTKSSDDCQQATVPTEYDTVSPRDERAVAQASSELLSPRDRRAAARASSSVISPQGKRALA
jgi:hypothetical protein